MASGDAIDTANDFTYKIYDAEGNELTGLSEVSEVGSYTIVASINGSSDLNKNYKLNDVSREWVFVVVPKSGMTILTIEWGETQFLYDGNTHYPTFVVKDINGNDVTSEVGEHLNFSDGYRTKKEIGTYSVKVTLKGAAADEYFIRSGSV